MTRLAATVLLPIFLWIGPAFGAPDNDSFANRTILGGTNISFRAYLLDAGVEAGEPNHLGEPDRSSQSVWWSWIAPEDGLVGISEEPGNFRAVVYKGATLESLTVVARWELNTESVPPFPVQRGESYQIAVVNRGGVETYPARIDMLRLRFYPHPRNDNFSDRIRIGRTRELLTGGFLRASLELGEPVHWGDGSYPSLWWEWTPPVSGLMTVRVLSGASGMVVAYTGSSLGGLVPAHPPNPGALPMPVRAGETLQLAVVNISGSAIPFEIALTASDMRIVSPESGARIAADSPLAIRLENVPSDVVSLTVESDYGSWNFPADSSELFIDGVRPGIHPFHVTGRAEDGYLYYSADIRITAGAGSDSFAGAIQIPGNAAPIGGDFSNATDEPGEPPRASPGPRQSGSIWWRWRAPGEGRVMTGPWAPAFGETETEAEFFTGSNLSNLRRVPQNVDLGLPVSGWPGKTARFDADPGVNYWVRLRMIGPPPYGWAGTAFAFQPHANNDAFAARIPLTGPVARQLLTPDFATFESDEPGSAPSEAGSRWFTHTAHANGMLRLSLEDWQLPWDRVSLMVFTGDSLRSLSSVGGSGTGAELRVRRGDTYQIRVVFPNDLVTYGSLNLKLDVIPDNDNVWDAIVIPAEDGILSGTNDGATRELGEYPVVGERSVWYRYTMPQDGALMVSARPSDDSVEWHTLDLRFAVTNTVGIWWINQAVDRGRAAVALSAGESVWLAVWNNLLTTARPTAFVLEHQFVPGPSNDLFQNRQTLAGTRIETRGTNWLATTEAREPYIGTPSSKRTVWWTWTAPASGILDVRNPKALLALYTGNSLQSLQRVWPADTTNNVLGGLRFPVIPGTNYQIVADRDDRQGGLGAFTTNGLEGFALSLRLGNVELASPGDRSAFVAGQPVEFTLKQASPALDGTIRSVTYVQSTNISGTIDTRSLGTTTRFPFSLTLTDLPPGFHQIQAIVTNEAGETLTSPVVAIRVIPANDNFANARELSGFSFTNVVTWSGATYEPGEPAGANASNGTVWFRWRAPATGILRVASPAPGLVLYRGDRLTDLVQVPRNLIGPESQYAVAGGTNYYARIVAPASDSSPGVARSGSLRFELIAASLISPGSGARYAAGQNVLLQLEATDPDIGFASVSFDVNGVRLATLSRPPWSFVWTNLYTGQYTVSSRVVVAGGGSFDVAPRTFIVVPANDGFSDAAILEGRSGTLRGTTLGSTSDISGLGDIWFNWTAPADGLLFVRRTGPTMDLFTGTDAANLELQPHRTTAAWQDWCWLVRSNVTYRLRAFDSSTPDFGEFDLRWDLRTRAENDNFADRFQLNGTEGEELASFVLGTIEEDETSMSHYYYSWSTTPVPVWWTWTPPEDGILQVDFADGPSSMATVMVFTGQTLSSLTRALDIGPMDWSSPGPKHYRVSAGVPLQLVIVGRSDGIFDVRWSWKLFERPSNDDFADRNPLRGTRISLAGTTTYATDEFADEAMSGGRRHSVWWTWTAPTDGDLYVWLSELRSPHSTVICRGDDVHSLEILQRLFHQPAQLEKVPLAVRAGDRLQIMVAGPWPGNDIELNLDLRHRPLNDDFANRERLEGIRPVVFGANWMSSRETGEPDHSGRPGGRSVWYAWRALTNGVAVVEVGSPSLALAAYEGDSLTTLREAGAMTLDGAPLRFAVQTGHDYAIAVDGISGFTGEFGLGIQLFDVLPIPFMSIGLDYGDVYRIDILDLTPGLWVLEKSGDLKTWTVVSNVSMYGPLPIYVTVTGGSMDFFRVCRLD